MESVQIMKLLARNAYVLQEDVKLMEDGAIKVQAFGVDVTREQAARLKANLVRLEEALAALGTEDS